MIRIAQLEDLRAIMEIELRCFSADRFRESEYLFFMTNPLSEVHVLTSSEAVTGSLVISFVPREQICHVISVAVHPDFQKRGHGQELMRFAQERALAKSCRTMELEVRIRNQGARRLYESLHYDESELLPHYYGYGSHGVVYRKRLLDQES